jgi:hypothetical protein
MKNKHSQPTQCPTGRKISASTRVRFSEYTDDNSPTKAQGNDIAPSAFRWANIGNPKGKRAPILRRLEEAEERNRQITKHNKIPLRQD